MAAWLAADVATKEVWHSAHNYVCGGLTITTEVRE